MDTITWFAGGAAHGRHVLHMGKTSFVVDGMAYRYYSGPYPLRVGQSYQVFVSAELDEEDADAAAILLLQQRLDTSFPVAY